MQARVLCWTGSSNTLNPIARSLRRYIGLIEGCAPNLIVSYWATESLVARPHRGEYLVSRTGKIHCFVIVDNWRRPVGHTIRGTHCAPSMVSDRIGAMIGRELVKVGDQADTHFLLGEQVGSQEVQKSLTLTVASPMPARVGLEKHTIEYYGARGYPWNPSTVWRIGRPSGNPC